MHKPPELEKISKVISNYKLRPKKSLSQNFLLDLNVTKRIVNSIDNLGSCDILEIGPGPGSLTRSLLSLGARRVIVIEKDAQFLAPLQEISEFYPGRLTIIHGDALLIDPEPLLTPPIKIISNLPYNIGTKILLNLVTAEIWPPFWESLTLMFQNEVANRLVALPRTKAYGRLSIITQLRSEVKILFKVPAASFTPQPKIESAVVKITPTNKSHLTIDHNILQKIVKLAFGQRRKMLRQSLKSLHPRIQPMLRDIGINPESRPEELSIEQFCCLATTLKNE
jgi:16S rRNA (adenine1518-N6/adenine1519-N6)-dimethyltransferase